MDIQRDDVQNDSGSDSYSEYYYSDDYQLDQDSYGDSDNNGSDVEDLHRDLETKGVQQGTHEDSAPKNTQDDSKEVKRVC
jgi:hypothetical protein